MGFLGVGLVNLFYILSLVYEFCWLMEEDCFIRSWDFAFGIRKPLVTSRTNSCHFCKLSFGKSPASEVETPEKNFDAEERGALGGDLSDEGNQNNSTAQTGG